MRGYAPRRSPKKSTLASRPARSDPYHSSPFNQKQNWRVCGTVSSLRAGALDRSRASSPRRPHLVAASTSAHPARRRRHPDRVASHRAHRARVPSTGATRVDARDRASRAQVSLARRDRARRRASRDANRAWSGHAVEGLFLESPLVAASDADTFTATDAKRRRADADAIARLRGRCTWSRARRRSPRARVR